MAGRRSLVGGCTASVRPAPAARRGRAAEASAPTRRAWAPQTRPYGRAMSTDAERQDYVVETLEDAFADLMEAVPGRVPHEVPQDGGRPVRVLPRQRLPVLPRPRRRRRPVGRRAHRAGVGARRPARRELRHLHELRRPAGLRRQRLRRGLPRATSPGTCCGSSPACRCWAGARRSRRTSVRELAGTATCDAYVDQVHALRRQRRRRGLRPAAGQHRRPGPRGCSARPGSPRVPTLLRQAHRARRRRADVPRHAAASAGSTTTSTTRCWRRSTPTSTRFPRTSGSTATCSTRSRTSSAGPASASAAPACTAYNVLIEGRNQALENDVVLSMKQGNVPAISRYARDDARPTTTSSTQGHRTVVSQRALQVHTDPFLGWTALHDTGYVVDELSPYESDLDWDDLTEPDQVEPVLRDLGRATAKVHCASDEDSDENLVEFQTEEAIAAVARRRPATASSRPRRPWPGLRRACPRRPRAVRRRVPRGPDRRHLVDLAVRAPGCLGAVRRARCHRAAEAAVLEEAGRGARQRQHARAPRRRPSRQRLRVEVG